MKPTPDQKFQRHRMVWESLSSPYRDIWPFVFPWGDQRQWTPRRQLESHRSGRGLIWRDYYTLVPRPHRNINGANLRSANLEPR